MLTIDVMFWTKVLFTFIHVKSLCFYKWRIKNIYFYIYPWIYFLQFYGYVDPYNIVNRIVLVHLSQFMSRIWNMFT